MRGRVKVAYPMPRFVSRECLWRRRGIAITRGDYGHGWTITHAASGFAVFPTFRARNDLLTLLRAANLLADTFDWRLVSTYGLRPSLSPAAAEELAAFTEAVAEMFPEAER